MLEKHRTNARSWYHPEAILHVAMMCWYRALSRPRLDLAGSPPIVKVLVVRSWVSLKVDVDMSARGRVASNANRDAFMSGAWSLVGGLTGVDIRKLNLGIFTIKFEV